MKQTTESTIWRALEKHSKELTSSTLLQLKKTSASRLNDLSFSNKMISIDCSNQRINKNTLELLLELAEYCQIENKISDLFSGQCVNRTEKRPALHTALRQLHNQSIFIDGLDILPLIKNTRNLMRDIAEKIRQGQWLGYSNRPITTIVNVGMGGSDLGPQFCIHALSRYAAPHLSYHFISDVDPFAFETVTEKLNPETTLFIISSKSFTTRETLYNTKKAMQWIGHSNSLEKHFIAVTANIEKAHKFGIKHVLPIWPWIGGRYSFCSAINLISLIAIGDENFSELLNGAYSMDQHFLEVDSPNNLPILMALIGIWNINFLNINNLLMLAYSNRLEYFIPYVQQLDMESNGKSINNQGLKLNYHTGPIVWGGLGNQAQHSYFQLLCQGTHQVAIDSLIIKDYETELINQSCNMKVKVLTEGIQSLNKPHIAIAGNIPFNIISIDRCTPFSIGELIALYEHKIYIQSVIWDINPFDQPGVESAKKHCFDD